MADGPITALADLIVPQIFSPYVQQKTEEKSRLIISGALVRDAAIDLKLKGAGLTFTTPSFKDLDNDDENISTDAADDQYTGGSNNSTPKKIGSNSEIAVRLSRNQSWSSADLASVLIGADPMKSVGNNVAGYWTRRLQRVFIATMTGVFANNASVPIGTEHEQDDLTFSSLNAGDTYVAGVTNFTAEGFLDTLLTIGDSEDDLGMMFVHSIIMNRMRKNNLIEYVEDSVAKIRIPTYQNRVVIQDDTMPFNDGVFETWVFGAGAMRFGVGTPKVPTETERHAGSGNGAGSEVLHNRVEWCLHPAGHKFIAAAEDGGPSNAGTSGNLAHSATFRRSFTERKQIKIARYLTREYAAA